MDKVKIVFKMILFASGIPFYTVGIVIGSIYWFIYQGIVDTQHFLDAISTK